MIKAKLQKNMFLQVSLLEKLNKKCIFPIQNSSSKSYSFLISNRLKSNKSYDYNLAMIKDKNHKSVFQKIKKNTYCEKIGNLIILNSKNEIKVLFDNSTYSIFFNENDSINVVNEKILGINSEKIQSVEFFDSNKKENLSEEEKNKILIKDFINKPFSIRINKYISSVYIPGIFPQLFSENENLNKSSDDSLKNINNSSDYFTDAETIKNFILLNLYSIKEKNKYDNLKYEEEKKLFIDDLINKLDNRKNFLMNLYQKQTLAEKVINDKLKFVSKSAVKLGMLFAVSHFSLFYLLIYKFYAWDVIEPITYIVGNVYWIFTLGFLAFKNRKLEFELLQYDSIKDIYFNKYAKQLSYSEEEKLKLEEELDSVEKIKLGIADI